MAEVTEKTIYICEDGVKFENRDYADSYNLDYNTLKPFYDECLGEKLPRPGIGEGYCLEIRHHTRSDIMKLVIQVLTIMNTHSINYDPEMKFHNEYFNVLVNKLSNLDNITDTEDLRWEFDRIISLFDRCSYFYFFDDDYYKDSYSRNIINKIIDRLKNTSYVTGIEYPPNSTCNWVFRENKWDDFVQSEKEYIAQGGKYR